MPSQSDPVQIDRSDFLFFVTYEFNRFKNPPCRSLVPMPLLLTLKHQRDSRYFKFAIFNSLQI